MNYDKEHHNLMWELKNDYARITITFAKKIQ